MRRQIATLVVAGFILQLLLVCLTLLYVNLPTGFQVPYGLNPSAVTLFRTLWPYPARSISPVAFHRMAALTVAALWAVYLTAALAVRRPQGGSARRWEAVLILAVASLWNLELALFFPPVLSSDVYNYALFGRVAVAHLNPYTDPCGALPNDPFWLLTLENITTPYGPTWTLVSALLAFLGRQTVVGTLLLFKAAGALFNVGSAILVFVLARRLQKTDGVVALLLYAWNPLFLIESAGSAHNDVVMVCIALLGVLLAANRRPVAALAILLISALIKYTTILLMVLYGAHQLARQSSWRRMAGFTARVGSASTLILAVFYLPFLFTDRPQQLLLGLTASLNRMPNPVPYLLRALLLRILTPMGDSTWSAAAAERGVIILLNLGFVVLLSILARRVMQERTQWPDIFTYFGIASLFYVYVVYSNSYPWQLLIPFTASILGASTTGNLRLLICCIGLGFGFTIGYT